MKQTFTLLTVLLLVLATRAAEPQPDTAPTNNLVIDLGGGVTMELALIRPGSFQMGDKQSLHKVRLTRPFYLGKYEVTQEQWEAVMGSNPSTLKGAKNPVETVSYEDCQTFVQKLGEKVHGRTFRLPTEAEWEFACRAGSTTVYCYGDAEAGLDEYGWYKDNSAGTTHPVGLKKPNAWGLYDMHGNVWEWCADWYGEHPKGEVTDPTGPATGEKRVSRGGECNRHANHATAAFRGKSDPKNRYKGCGVRVVVETR